MKNSLLFLSFILLFFTACGGEDDKWGIDEEPQEKLMAIILPVCNDEKNSTTNTIKITMNQKVEKRKDNTVVRIWHYQNGDKLICTVQGEAIVYEKNSHK